MIRLIIADDHRLIRQGLRLLLADDDRFSLAGEAGSGSEALTLIRDRLPDVAVLDLNMPPPDGIEVTAQVRAEQLPTRCIMLTMNDNIAAVRRALAAGAWGYLLKDAAYEDIAEALVKVYHGKLSLGSFQDRPELFRGSASTELTPREDEVLRMVARGLTSVQIAEQLYISPRTVDTHRGKIMDKLNIHNAVALAAHARERGLA